ncbi:hypothetical protein lacNasYZ03_18990 [Lactobacillus nasalidis]|uniref:Uncharacterized protein n=1 Tax=Lactobacillus nasalidis TaxID=2797258 RepID=A0ABQ3WDC6_9LACO|nr:hypothetical protein lacNasYZ01_09290 [Lactobacillus nasalidis]GHV98572.1 hypothetical protein lacNasYZ02_00020 [Lactobacillus nasalidis]GHW02212.1 hypothetical protein lacNasYZ03_18990 [Lactobacillus nasalidis]
MEGLKLLRERKKSYNMIKDDHLDQYEPIGITDDFMFFAVMSVNY